jgi:hypothetical protein
MLAHEHPRNTSPTWPQFPRRRLRELTGPAARRCSDPARLRCSRQPAGTHRGKERGFHSGCAIPRPAEASQNCWYGCEARLQKGLCPRGSGPHNRRSRASSRLRPIPDSTPSNAMPKQSAPTTTGRHRDAPPPSCQIAHPGRGQRRAPAHRRPAAGSQRVEGPARLRPNRCDVLTAGINCDQSTSRLVVPTDRSQPPTRPRTATSWEARNLP